VKAVPDVSYELKLDEIFGLVGESGCGKSTTTLAILRMLEITAGRIVFKNEYITAYEQKTLRPALAACRWSTRMPSAR